MRSRVLGIFLKNLWNFTRVYIERGDSTPLPSYVYIAFTYPEITRRILEKGNIAAHVTRRCAGALIVNKLATDINARTLVNDARLKCLSVILDTDSQDVQPLLSHPGAIQFANMIFLVSDDIYDSLLSPTSDVLDVIRQTFSILSQALPAQSEASMELDLTDTLMEVSEGWFELMP